MHEARAAHLLIGEHLAWCRRRGLAAETITRRRAALLAIEADSGLLTCGPDDIERFLDRKGELAAKTRYQWVSHLHQFFRWAINWDHLAHDPTLQVARPKQRHYLPRPVSVGDMQLAVALATPMMRAWLLLAGYAGLRCVEISRLEVDDIRWDENIIIVRGKGSKERAVPMHPDVRDALMLAGSAKRGRVFQRPRGGGWPAANVSRHASQFLQDCGINATLHQFRHRFGTDVYATSHDLRVTQELLGHSSPTTTAVYADYSRDTARAAVMALGQQPHQQPTTKDNHAI